jgi:hypothetical protein
MTDESLKAYRDAWNKLDEVLNERTSWGRDQLRNRMHELLIACLEAYL